MRTLSVTVVEARDLKNRDGMFGKNDAFVNLKIGSKKEKTTVIKNAGSKATWNETFKFEIKNEKDFLHIEVMDYDKISLNDFIGMVNVPLNSVLNSSAMECWYPLINNGKPAGELNLFLKLENPAGNNQSHAPQQGNNHPPQQGGPPPQQSYPPQQGGGYPPQQGGGYPPQQGGGYPPQQGGGYPPQPGYPPQQGGGYPPQQGGGYPPQQGGGYPPQQGGGYPPQQGGGYPPQQGGGYPPQQGGGYPPQQGGGYPPQ